MTYPRLFAVRSALLVLAVAALAWSVAGQGAVTHDVRAVATAVVVMFGLPGIAEWVGRRAPGMITPMFVATLACALFLLAVGVDMAVGWVDPVAANPAGMQGVHLHGKQALIVPLIEYWPYVLILAGGFFGWATGVILQRRVTPPRRPA